MGKHADTVGFRNCCRLFLRQNLSLSLTEVFCPCLKKKYIILWKFYIFHNYVNNLMWTNFHRKWTVFSGSFDWPIKWPCFKDFQETACWPLVWLQEKWHILPKPLKNTNFSNQMPYRLVWLLRKFYIFIKWPVSRDNLLPFGVLEWKLHIFIKWTDFSDSNEFLKEILLPFRLKWTKWTDFSEISWSQEITKMNRL